jgi:serine/threonine-protein kinase PknG
MVPENRRFCALCDEPVGRGRDGAPGRTTGFFRKCGAPFSFEPKLRPGELVAGQYEVVG